MSEKIDSSPSMSRSWRISRGRTIDLVLVVAEDDDRRWRLLQTLEKVDHLGLLFDIFHFLNDVQVGGTGSADVDENRVDKGLLRKVLDLARHGGREQQGLALVLSRHGEVSAASKRRDPGNAQ